MKTCRLLYLEQDAWQLVDEARERVEFPPDELASQAERIAELCSGHQPLVIGLDAAWCLPATVPIAAPQMLRRPQVMRYHLEQWIPWSAEDYVTAWAGHKQQAFMVAVKHELLACLLTALEQTGIQVAAMVPLDLLILQHLQTTEKLPSNFQLLLQTGVTLQRLVIRDHMPYRWDSTGHQYADVVRLLEADKLSQVESFPLYICRLDEGLTKKLQSGSYAATVLSSSERLTAAQSAAQSIISGKSEPLIDLRRDELSGEQAFQTLGKERGRLKLAGALLLISLALAFWYRGLRYQQATNELQGKLKNVYHELFPEQNTPDSVSRAINKEYQFLLGTRTPADDLPVQGAADVILQRILACLPAKMRFRILEIRIEQERTFLTGEVRSNADADQLAEALRKADFIVDPPRIQRLSEKGFSVRLSMEQSSKPEKSSEPNGPQPKSKRSGADKR